MFRTVKYTSTSLRSIRLYSSRATTSRAFPAAKKMGVLGALGATGYVFSSLINNDTKVEDIEHQERPQNNDPKTESKDDEDNKEPTAEDYDGAAYNPITGEINWDCPCLGGMAHGPCGEEFKEAFACFVYSETEPKGMDCIKKFEAMRTCFRRYPEHYKEQLLDEEELEREVGGDSSSSSSSSETPVAQEGSSNETVKTDSN